MEMNMKKLISIAVAASMMLIGTTAFAQASIGAGYINETNKVKIGDNASSMGALNGFYAGFGYDINEGEGFGISTGLYYSFLTGNVSVPSLSVISGDMTEHALNIPVKAGFSVPVGSGLKGFLNVGPTFVCGLASSIKPLGVDLLKTDNYKHEYLGRFDIMIDTDNNCIDSYTWKPVPINPENCPKDPDIERVIDAYQSQTDAKYGQILTKFVRKLTHPMKVVGTSPMCPPFCKCILRIRVRCVLPV